MSAFECEKDILIVRFTTGRFWHKADLRPNLHVAEGQQQAYPSEHNSVVTPKAQNRLALEFAFGRSGARWYVPYSFKERARWLKRNSRRTCRTGCSSTRTAILRVAEPMGTCTR